MEIRRDDDAPEHVVTVEGEVGPGQVRELRASLFAALEGSGTDLVLDGRLVTWFDDTAISALSAARSRHHRVVVADHGDGNLTASLHRTGLVFRFPVYPDPAAATAALAADRSALAAMRLPLET